MKRLLPDDPALLADAPGAVPPREFDWRGRLPALALAGSSRTARQFAHVLVLITIPLLIGVIFLPWQQSIRGTGRVIAFDPLDRRLNVEAPVAGRVKKLNVVEGQRVKRGDVIVEIEDNDPNLIGNLELQRNAVGQRMSATEQRVVALDLQIAAQERARTEAITAARERVVSDRATADTARLNLDRTEILAKSGLVSQRDLELALLARDSSAAQLAASQATLARTGREFDATIAGLRAALTQARADVAVTERDAAALATQVSSARRQTVESPRDGVVFRVATTEGTYLRPGSPVAVIIPETESRFVEIWLDGNDVPLVTPRHTDAAGNVVPGSPARLRFEGWPAIQFVGWPSVAVGTFGGEVVFVDATDDGHGKFRVVVAQQPDIVQRDGRTEKVGWPSNRWLRQGVRADGWVLLQQVPLWREIWRQLNAFPPIVADREPAN
ncbi:MAG: HlyD family secretion protein [Burkholderiales bacterium]|jgi:multidrug resistance efflux pump|nr:HlyD family secretion protein [Burkholderiales bacterium]